MKTTALVLHATRARSPGKGESLPHTCKYVVLGNTAGISLIDGRAQRNELRLRRVLTPMFVDLAHWTYCSAGRKIGT